MIRRVLLYLVLLLPSLGAAAISDDEPLPPEEAFKLTTATRDANTVRATWTIVDGYYLYREKFQFSSDTPGIAFGTPSFPKGKIKEDEFFGKVETYRNQVAVDIPIARAAASGDTLQLTAVYQGCADMGVCYPPQTLKVSLKLPPGAAVPVATPAAETIPKSSSSDSGAFSALKKLGSSFGLSGDDEPFLEVDKAFAYSADVADGNTIVARWKIADGYYLYREKFGFEIRDATGVTIGAVNFPKGEMKNDEAFGNMEVYHDGVELRVPLLRTVTTPTNVSFVARYQGCAEKGFCYPPQEQVLPMALPTATSQSNSAAQMTSSAGPQAPISEQDQIAASLATGNKLWVVLSFFGFGLLLAFTPCVFPMIPILSSIIVGQGEGLSTRRAFTLSLVYVMAMAVTYTVAGIIAGMFGANVQAAFQNPWILGSFAAVFVLLSLSMFGFYELQMPSFIQSKLTEISNRQKGGTLFGVGIMGFLSALIVGPCVAAPLAGALIYIGQTGDAVLGGVALFALSMGMGAPLLAIGTSAGKILPRAGTWMETIKAVFGVLLLAVAIWMIERVIPAQVALLLWALLLIISSIYMGALEPHGIDATGWKKLWKGVGLVMLTYGVLLVIGAASGARDMFQPLQHLAAGPGGGGGAAVAAESHVTFKRIRGIEALDREIAAANAQGKPVMLDFYADWCISCKEMEKFTFSDAGVRETLSGVVLLQADVTANDDIDKALLKRFSLIGPPSILFFGTDGQERRAYRLVGFIKPKEFRTHVERALSS
jgi:thiol:disulfide interchange protein DsbD